LNSGFHIDVKVDGMWRNSFGFSMSSCAIPGLTFSGAVASIGRTDFIGGGQIGHDLQIHVKGAGFVAGVEADIQGIAAGGGGKWMFLTNWSAKAE